MNEQMDVTECLSRYDNLILRYPIMKLVAKVYILYAKIFDFANEYSYEEKRRLFEELESVLKDLDAP